MFPDIVEKREFQAETRMLLDIVAKSLYSDKEVNSEADEQLKNILKAEILGVRS